MGYISKSEGVRPVMWTVFDDYMCLIALVTNVCYWVSVTDEFG